MRCAVCSSESATAFNSAGGQTIGHACPGECSALLWESWFNVQTGAPSHERKTTLWKWRRRQAEVGGRRFSESPPRSVAEAEIDAVVMAAGLTEIAKELE